MDGLGSRHHLALLSDSIIYDSITCGRYHYTYRDKYCQSKYVWTHVGEDRTVEVVSCHGWRWHTGGHILERQHPVWNADQRNGNIGGERHRRIKYSLWEDQYPSFKKSGIIQISDEKTANNTVMIAWVSKRPLKGAAADSRALFSANDNPSITIG